MRTEPVDYGSHCIRTVRELTTARAREIGTARMAPLRTLHAKAQAPARWSDPWAGRVPEEFRSSGLSPTSRVHAGRIRGQGAFRRVQEFRTVPNLESSGVQD